MKTTMFTLALVLLTSVIVAQSPQKTTVRIKKVEVVNGVQKVTDTTFTTDNPEAIKYLDGNTSVRENNGKRVIAIRTGNSKDEVLIEPEIDQNGIIRIESDGKERRKLIIMDRANPGDSLILRAGKPLTPEEEAMWEKACKDGTMNEEIIEVNTLRKTESTNDQPGKITKVTIVRKIIISDASPEEKAKLNKTSGSSDEKLRMSEMKFFPNPNNGKFNLAFNLEEKGNAEITIMDLEGKLIYSEKLNDFSGAYQKEIDISSNPKGIYFVKVQQGDHSQLKKIVLD